MGISTRFFTDESLGTKLSESKRTRSLERVMKKQEKAQLVTINEWGYLPMDREEAQLFQVVASSYERRSIYSKPDDTIVHMVIISSEVGPRLSDHQSAIFAVAG